MTSHHAVLLTSDAPLTYSPDASVIVSMEYRLSQFKIDDVRTLIAEAHRRPAGDAVEQTLLVATEFITEEAQQALLKIVEEPPLSTKFIFVIPEGYTLLATLESRFERVMSEESGTSSEAFSQFVDASYKDRMEAIEESVKKKNHAWQQEIKNGLVAYLKTRRSALSAKEVNELEYISRLLLTRGASNKFLLEHLALALGA
ncbi:MAG: polymerase delta subunit [Candidatus Parcubacteria bacterium]